MRNLKSDNRSKFRGRTGGSQFGRKPAGRGEFRNRDSRRSERRPEMHDVTCDKCGKQCQVPFNPTSSKPVFCNDCFRKNEGSSNNFGSRNQERNSQSGRSQSGMSSEQFNKINTKLDKIIQALEIESEDDSEEDLDEDSEEDSEED